MKFFKDMTANSTVIMGRKTLESMGRTLPHRHNIVLTNGKLDLPEGPIEVRNGTLKAIVSECSGNVWLIGGSSIYQQGLELAEEIYVTTIPEIIMKDDAIYFPYVNPDQFKIADRIELSKEKNLYCNVFKRHL